jgi:hypothetical protein
MMPLSDQEALQAFEQLRAALMEVGLAWILDQVDAQLALGKLTPRDLSKGDLMAVPEGVPTVSYAELRAFAKPGTYVASEEYTSQERIAILIEAIREATSGVVQVGVATGTTIATFTGRGNTDIQFAPDGPLAEFLGTQPSDRMGYALSEITGRSESTAVLARLLDELLA